MAHEPPHYRPGDVVNGHVLSATGQWMPVATPESPPGDVYPPPSGHQQGHPDGVAPRYRPGDVVNGFVLNASYQWEPAVVSPDDADSTTRRPPTAVTIGSGVLALVPLIGWVFAIIAITLGGRILSTRSADDKGDLAVGGITFALGILGVFAAVNQFLFGLGF